MSLFDPTIVAENFAAALHQDPPEEDPPPLSDRHQRLLEAGVFGCCAEGDLLALMPSVDRPDLPWLDGRAWLVRILGF